MQISRGGMGFRKHRQANRHKVAKSRYVYEFAAAMLNAEADKAARRRRPPLPYASVIEAVEAASRRRR